VNVTPDAVGDLAECIARRVVELLTEQPGPPEAWLDAAAVAARYGVSRAWVYDHAEDLGAARLGEAGDGRKPRLRFDPAKVAAFFEESPSAEEPEPAEKSPHSIRRQTRGGTTASGAPLLEVRGEGGAGRA
jgi:hypothetical protein